MKYIKKTSSQDNNTAAAFKDGCLDLSGLKNACEIKVEQLKVLHQCVVATPGLVHQISEFLAAQANCQCVIENDVIRNYGKHKHVRQNFLRPIIEKSCKKN